MVPNKGKAMAIRRPHRRSRFRLNRNAIFGGRASDRAKPSRKDLALSIAKDFDSFLAVCRRLVINVTFVVASIAVLFMLFKAIKSKVIIIEPVLVPKSLIQQGYTPEVFAKRLASELKRIDQLAISKIPREHTIGLLDHHDFKIPGQAFSFQTFVKHTKEILGIGDTSVLINVTEEKGAYSTHISINNGPYHGASDKVRSMISSDSETFVHEVAKAAMGAVQPIVLASYEVAMAEKDCRRPPCNYEEALSLYAKIISRAPTHDDKWALLGKTYVLLGTKRYEEVTRICQTMGRTYPNFAPAYNNWGLALTELGHHDEALVKFDKAIYLNERSPISWINKSKLYFKLKKYNEARSTYAKAMELHPDLNRNGKYDPDLRICIDRLLPRDEMRPKRQQIDQNFMRAIIVMTKLWPNGSTLRVSFMGGKPSVQKKVEQIAHEWSRYANVKFEFGDNPESEIRISFHRGPSWSYTGTDATEVPRDMPTMNLGWLNQKSSDREYRKVVLHQFGHALGLGHEHHVPPAGFSWNKPMIYKYFGGPPNYWSKKHIDHHFFEKYDSDHLTGIEPDTNSVMSFPIPREFFTTDFKVGWNTILSDGDKKYIGSERAYPF